MYLRYPPKIKVLEALASIADGRVKLLGNGYAEVTSSDGSRKYKVYVDLSRGEACSTDNGTLLRGYIGYPIIAVLMALNKLPIDERIANALKGINWRELNERFKKYSLVEEYVKKLAMKKGLNPNVIDMYRDRVYTLVKKLRLRLVVSKCKE